MIDPARLLPLLSRAEDFLVKHFQRLFRGFLIVLPVLAIAVPLAIVALPFLEFLNGMAAQPKARTQMTYGRSFDEARLVDREPVPGTVHRQWRAPYAYDALGNELKDAKKVGEKLMNPIGRTLEAMKRGQNRYDIYCAVCHGKGGHGDGPVVGVDRFPAPPSLHTKDGRAYKDGTIFHIVTKGNGDMPAYFDKLTPEDRWRVIHYVRALQRAQNPTPEDLKK